MLVKPNSQRVSFVRALALIILIGMPSAHALREPDLSGSDLNAVVVYDFSEMGGNVVRDISGIGTPLDLTMSTAGNLPTADGTAIRTNAMLQDGYLLINPKPNGAEIDDPDSGYQSAQRHRTFLVSSGSADKLNACTSGFTIQAFVRPWFPFQGNDNGNLIVGLSNSEGSDTVVNPNFGVYQSGESGAESVTLRVRTGANSADSVTSGSGGFSSVRQGDNPGRLTEIIATQEANGVLTVYVNRVARSTITRTTPVFSPNAKLVIGNELSRLTANAEGEAVVTQQRNWSGEIYHLAIYCQGVTRNQVLGGILANKARSEVVHPRSGATISSPQLEARKLIERLTGVGIPIDHPMVQKAQDKIASGDRLGAAKIVTGDLATAEPGHPEFLNTLLKQFALKMSNREETIRVAFNDFAASFIGVARDELSAKSLLTEDFFYMANPNKAKVRTDVFKDILVSNNHYQDLESGQWDFGKVLMRVPGPEAPTGYPPGQMIANEPTGGMAQHPDPAGVLTSRAFLEAHAVAGTNRRIVEYAFRAFMCMPMGEMADTSASPARIGRDVERTPGGDATKFETSCKGCHTVMDGFRGAFAHFDFASITFNGSALAFVRNTEVSGTGPMGFGRNAVDEFGTVRKMNHNEDVFLNGHVIQDNSFVNNAVGSANRLTFGWGGANKVGGVGANQFGRLLADSVRFSECMAQRAYEAVCTPSVASTSSNISEAVKSFASRFRENGYKLRGLFADVAASPACAAGMGR